MAHLILLEMTDELIIFQTVYASDSVINDVYRKSSDNANLTVNVTRAAPSSSSLKFPRSFSLESTLTDRMLDLVREALARGII